MCGVLSASHRDTANVLRASDHQVRVCMLGDQQCALQHVNLLLTPLHLVAVCLQGLQAPAIQQRVGAGSNCSSFGASTSARGCSVCNSRLHELWAEHLVLKSHRYGRTMDNRLPGALPQHGGEAGFCCRIWRVCVCAGSCRCITITHSLSPLALVQRLLLPFFRFL